jgi:hypothetical protein
MDDVDRLYGEETETGSTATGGSAVGWRVVSGIFSVEVCTMSARCLEELRAHGAGARCCMSKAVAVSAVGVDAGVVLTQN